MRKKTIRSMVLPIPSAGYQIIYFRGFIKRVFEARIAVRRRNNA